MLGPDTWSSDSWELLHLVGLSFHVGSSVKRSAWGFELSTISGKSVLASPASIATTRVIVGRIVGSDWVHNNAIVTNLNASSSQ